MQVDPTQQQVNNSLNINGNDPSPSGTSSPAGIWQGSYTIGDKTYPVIGIINSSGDARFALSSGVNFAGNVSAQSSQLSGLFSVYNPDGIINGSTSLTGSFSPRGNMTATYTAPAGSSSTYNGSLDVSYNEIYSNDASFSTIAGYWDDINSGLFYSIGADGAFTASDNKDGCFYSGNITIPSLVNNVYKLTLTIYRCGKAGSYSGSGYVSGNNNNFTYFISSSTQAYSETLSKE